jgi:hypothetical protein
MNVQDLFARLQAHKHRHAVFTELIETLGTLAEQEEAIQVPGTNEFVAPLYMEEIRDELAALRGKEHEAYLTLEQSEVTLVDG